VILIWAILKDRKDGVGDRGPAAARTLKAAFSATGMANAAVIIIFGVGAMRDNDFAVWLYYSAIVFALQAAAWYVAWTLKRKGWMLATAIGGWITAVALGVLVRETTWYLAVCTVALFLLFALPGWVMFRDARAVRTAD
jgi:ABC-type Na+ efflux pump permease subunit